MDAILHDHELYTHLLREQEGDEALRRGQLSSSMQSFITSASFIFGLSQAQRLKASTEFVDQFLYYLGAVVIASSLEIYFQRHILPKPTLIGVVAFRGVLMIFQTIRSYFTVLLLGLLRDQLSSTVSQELWDQVNIAPLLIVVILYFVLNGVQEYYISRHGFKKKYFKE